MSQGCSGRACDSTRQCVEIKNISLCVLFCVCLFSFCFRRRGSGAFCPFFSSFPFGTPLRWTPCPGPPPPLPLSPSPRPPSAGPPKKSLFFPLPRPCSLFFFLPLSLFLGGLVEFWWCLKRYGQFHFGQFHFLLFLARSVPGPPAPGTLPLPWSPPALEPLSPPTRPPSPDPPPPDRPKFRVFSPSPAPIFVLLCLKSQDP